MKRTQRLQFVRGRWQRFRDRLGVFHWPAGIAIDLLAGHARMNRDHCHFLCPVIWLEHAVVGDELARPLGLEAKPCAVVPAFAVSKRGDKIDFADEAALTQVDLQLSGHSHGGQIWIPGIGAPWLPELARIYPRGLYQVENLTLYTNVGVGTIHVPIRINCIPEVTLITLRTAGT